MDGDRSADGRRHVSGDSLSDYFAQHPPTLVDHEFYYLCAQHYAIDPTGWAVQLDLDFKVD